MKLIVGLGNPGRKYEQTRHNIGFLVLDRLAEDAGVALRRRVCDSLVGEIALNNERILLAKPQTYMNRSGAAVAALLKEFRSSNDELVVVYDELDLPFGRIRIRPNGSAAGHRGVLSIRESLAGAPFYRVRVGIGRPPADVDPADFVLEGFSIDESAKLDEIVSRAAKASVSVLQEGALRAMELYNRAS